MKKLITTLVAIHLCIGLCACGALSDGTANPETQYNSPTTNTNSTEASDSSTTENLSKWQMAGKGVGKILPEPQMEYSLPQSSSFIAAEIENATYEFFEDYVNQCIQAGFAGSISTAESPDYYFNGETANGERVQVMFYEDDSKCSISAFPTD